MKKRRRRPAISLAFYLIDTQSLFKSGLFFNAVNTVISGRKKEFALILKLNAVSDILAYKMVKELNAAKNGLSAPNRLAM